MFLQGKGGKRARSPKGCFGPLISPRSALAVGFPAGRDTTGIFPVLEDVYLAYLGDGVPLPSFPRLKAASKSISYWAKKYNYQPRML